MNRTVMSRTVLTLAAALALSAVGCEEKKDATSLVDSAKKSVGDAAGKVGEAAKDAASKAGDKAGEMADQAKTGMDDLLKGGASAMTAKVNEMMAEWKPTVDSLKAKIASAAPDVKPQIESAVSAIETQWKNVEAMAAKFKDTSADKLKDVGTEAFNGAEKLGTMIKDAAAKFLK